MVLHLTCALLGDSVILGDLANYVIYKMFVLYIMTQFVKNDVTINTLTTR